MRVRFIKRLWFYPKAIAFTIYTLTFNAFQSNSPLVDCAFEPVIWLVDHFAGLLGRSIGISMLIYPPYCLCVHLPAKVDNQFNEGIRKKRMKSRILLYDKQALVILVSFAISGVVVVFYVYVMPIVLEYENSVFVICHLVCGHWLLLNVAFHYYKAVSTDPGYPPSGKQALALKDIQVCTKCVQPKLPRTHHCSVCNKCILKMDHHCPWINNCVGLYNHRYFFMFCVYMCLGTIYVSLTLFPTFLDHIDFFAKNTFKSYFNIGVPQPTSGYKKYFMKPQDPINKENKESIHNIVVFDFMLCSCVAVAVGALAAWHAMLITRGETSVEVYINKSTRKKMKKEGKKFINPYNYGIISNWKMVLGLGRSRGLWSIVMPSSHPPNGDGITWPQLQGSGENSVSGIGKDKAAFMA